MLDFTPIEDYGQFFAWYLTQIKVYAPEYLLITPTQTHNKIPALTKDEMNQVVKQINRIQKVPKGIIFRSDNSAGTFYSYWDKKIKKAVIAFPAALKWMLRYPSVVKAAIQHEMGHIINKDIFVQIKGHGSCTNKCMDCRINQNINYDIFEKLMQCTFSFTTAPAKKYMIIPEYFLEDSCGLPSSYKDKIGWKEIHNAFHNFQKTMNQDADELPEEGAFILTLKEFRSPGAEEGEDKIFARGTVGIITKREPTEQTFLYTCTQINEELENTFLTNNYPEFVRLMQAGNIYKDVIASGMIFNKDFVVVQPPQPADNTPKVGDAVIFLEPITSRKDEPTYGAVTGGDAMNGFEVMIFSEDMQKAILEANVKNMIKIIQGSTFMTEEIVTAQFPNDIMVIDLGLPKQEGGKGPSGKSLNNKREPVIGDITYVTEEGANKGKYGIIQSISKDENGEDDFTIKEMDEKLASIILGR